MGELWRDFIQLLNNGWVGSALGILGIALSWVFYMRGKREGRLVYYADGWTVVDAETSAPVSDSIEIWHGGHPVPRVTATELFVWNAGSGTLSGSQLVHSDPLQMVGIEGEVLSVAFVRTTREASSWHFVADPAMQQALVLAFDYLEPQDGACVRVLHTSPSTQCALQGSIRGQPRGPIRLTAVRGIPHGGPALLARPAVTVGSARSHGTHRYWIVLAAAIVVASGATFGVWRVLNEMARGANIPNIRPARDLLWVLVGLLSFMVLTVLLFGVRPWEQRVPQALLEESS